MRRKFGDQVWLWLVAFSWRLSLTFVMIVDGARFRWQMVCLQASYEPIIPAVKNFLSSQGRMKYTRPLFRALYKFKSNIATDLFTQVKLTLHPICRAMVEKDFRALSAQ